MVYVRRLSRVADAVWVYHYEFDGGVLGALHAAELPALFGTQDVHWALSMMSGSRNHPKVLSCVSNNIYSANLVSLSPDIPLQSSSCHHSTLPFLLDVHR